MTDPIESATTLHHGNFASAVTTALAGLSPDSMRIAFFAFAVRKDGRLETVGGLRMPNGEPLSDALRARLLLEVLRAFEVA